MIAANYRKFPEAMALQMVLDFGRALIWALPRPTTRILRKIRSERGAAFKAAGRIAYPAPSVKPQWLRDFDKAVRALGVQVKESCMAFMMGEVA